MNFTSFGLHDNLLRGISSAHLTTPTPIQARSIPVILSGADVLGCAQTGTGKTAAFVIPLLERLLTQSHQRTAEHSTAQSTTQSTTQSSTHHTQNVHKTLVRPVRALILSPTRELVLQIEETTRMLARYAHLRIGSLYGGTSIDQQIKMLRYGADIIVATPGRLNDHLQRKTIDLSHVDVVVLDEADRMLDMGFIKQVQSILAETPNTRQTLLFSATMSPEIQRLTRTMQKNPQVIEVGERIKPAESVTQYFYSAPQAQKINLLLHVLEHEKETMENVIVFSRTKHGADRINRRLERKGFKSVALHSNRTQSQREKALLGFKQGKYSILIATDIAARGIDIQGVSHVINFDTPPAPEDYIHRIGRTGRADATGDALTFVARDEEQHIRKIERHIGKRHPLRRYPNFDYSAAPEPEPADINPEATLHRHSRQRVANGTRHHKSASKRTTLSESIHLGNIHRAGVGSNYDGQQSHTNNSHKNNSRKHYRARGERYAQSSASSNKHRASSSS
jgi:ATP-dependent RNA helicase RhlE